MSTYYNFYLGKKNAKGKMFMAGPYRYDMDTDKYKMMPLFSTSRSFIDWQAFEEVMAKLPVEDMAEGYKDYMTTPGFFNSEEVYSCTYYCDFSKMVRLANQNHDGLYQGYVDFNDLDYIVSNNYALEDRYDVDLKSADIVAEMQPEDRAKYGKVAFVAYNDPSFQADRIYYAAAALVDDLYGEKLNDYYILAVVG